MLLETSSISLQMNIQSLYTTVKEGQPPLLIIKLREDEQIPFRVIKRCIEVIHGLSDWLKRYDKKGNRRAKR